MNKTDVNMETSKDHKEFSTHQSSQPQDCHSQAHKVILAAIQSYASNLLEVDIIEVDTNDKSRIIVIV